MAFNQFGLQQPYVPQYPQQYFNPTAQQPPAAQPVQQPAQQGSGIIWAQGKEAAKAWPVRPGSSEAIFDSEADRFFIKTVDLSGMPQPLREFRYSEVLEDQNGKETYATREELEALAKKLETMLAKPSKKVKEDEHE